MIGGLIVIKLRDFRRDVLGLRREANDMVSSATNYRITDFLPSNAITPWAKMILLNAIFLNARWAEPFDWSYWSTDNKFIGQGVTMMQG